MSHMQEEGTASFHGRYGTSRLPRQLDASSETRMTDPNYYILPSHDLHTGDMNPYYPEKACLECAQSNSPFYYIDSDPMSMPHQPRGLDGIELGTCEVCERHDVMLVRSSDYYYPKYLFARKQVT